MIYIYSLLTKLRCLNDFPSNDSIVEKSPNLTTFVEKTV